MNALSRERVDASSRGGNWLWGPRLRVRLRQRVLDREIAAGLRVDEDAARELRAKQLTSSAERRQIAACLANMLEAAYERQADPGSHLRLNHEEVLAARHDLVALIEALRSEQALHPRGVALAQRLIHDNHSPLLVCRAGRTVQRAVSETLAAL